MPNYRRAFVPGGTYFFTVVTAGREPWLGTEAGREILARAMRDVRARQPFRTHAIVVLPDHLHCVWTLPPHDCDFSNRWKAIKQRCSLQVRRQRLVFGDAVWQRRFWEHLICDDADLERHIDYIHYNPVKHGWVDHPRDWPATSFRQHVEQGWYPADWGGPEVSFEAAE